MNEVITQSEAIDKARKLIQEGQNTAVGGFMMIGAGMDLVVKFKLHKASGQTLAQYIAETKMSWAKAHQALRVYREYGHLDTKGVLHSRLIALSPLRMDEAQKIEAISEAKELGPRDFERFVAEKKGKTLPELCPHEKTVTICEKCRTRIK